MKNTTSLFLKLFMVFLTLSLFFVIFYLILFDNDRDIVNQRARIIDIFGTTTSISGFEDYTVSDRTEINLQPISGEITTRFYQNIILTEIELNSEKETTVTFEFDTRQYVMYGLRFLNENNHSEFNAAQNFVRLVNNGNNKYLLMLNHQGGTRTPINLKIYQDNQKIFEHNLATGVQ